MRAALPPLFAIALAFAAPAYAQEATDDRADVTATVTAFMAAFEAKDGAAMSALLTEDAYLAWVRENEGGDPTQSMRLADMASGIGDIPARIAEPLAIHSVMVDGPVAMVWADYGFYLDGALTHCGVDIFTLMQVAGDWKIATITYSHETRACEDAPTL